MMPSTSNLKQQERNWLDLPPDVMANILKRIGLVDIIENAQKVCTTWHKIYKDPAMWRVIYINASQSSAAKLSILNMFKHAVDRSQGQLVDITLTYPYRDLLLYAADRSSQLRRLELASCISKFVGRLTTNALIKFPLLEELNLCSIKISKEDVEIVGRYCPMLKTLKVNRRGPRGVCVRGTDDEIAIAISQNLLELRHLELIGHNMTNIGLRVILDNCHHLETLDLRECFYVDLKGDLGKQCSQQIKTFFFL